jgi:hypothetical protein
MKRDFVCMLNVGNTKFSIYWNSIALGNECHVLLGFPMAHSCLCVKVRIGELFLKINYPFFFQFCPT